METMGVPDRWPNYSKVRFRSDQHRANGAPEGSAGSIVEVYDDAYEVEVTDWKRAKRCSSEPFLTPTSI
jgi:hypothetical protein